MPIVQMALRKNTVKGGFSGDMAFLCRFVCSFQANPSFYFELEVLDDLKYCNLTNHNFGGTNP